MHSQGPDGAPSPQAIAWLLDICDQHLQFDVPAARASFLGDARAPSARKKEASLDDAAGDHAMTTMSPGVLRFFGPDAPPGSTLFLYAQQRGHSSDHASAGGVGVGRSKASPATTTFASGSGDTPPSGKVNFSTSSSSAAADDESTSAVTGRMRVRSLERSSAELVESARGMALD